MKHSVKKEAARLVENSDWAKRAKRKNGGSRRKGRNVGVLSKANGFRP